MTLYCVICLNVPVVDKFVHVKEAFTIIDGQAVCENHMHFLIKSKNYYRKFKEMITTAIEFEKNKR